MSYKELDYKWREPTTLTHEELRKQEEIEQRKIPSRLDLLNYARLTRNGISQNESEEELSLLWFFRGLTEEVVGKITYTEYLRKFLNARIETGT